MTHGRECRAAREHMLEHLYGELEAGDAGAFERHLADCAACRAEHERLGQAGGLLDLWSIEQPEEDLRRVSEDAALRARAQRSRRRVPWRPLLAGAAAAVLAFALLALLGAEARVQGRELVISLRLPAGAAAAPSAEDELAVLEERVRAIAREESAAAAGVLQRENRMELEDFALREEARRAELAVAFDRALLAGRRDVQRLISAVSQEAAVEDRATRDAVVELAKYVTRSDPSPR